MVILALAAQAQSLSKYIRLQKKILLFANNTWYNFKMACYYREISSYELCIYDVTT